MLYECCVSDVTRTSLTDRVPDSVENIHVSKVRQGNENKKLQEKAGSGHGAEAPWTLDSVMLRRVMGEGGSVEIGSRR